MTTEGAVDAEVLSLKNGESTIDEETRKLFRGNPRPPIYDLSGKLTNPQDHPRLIQAMREEAKREVCDPMLKAFVTSLPSTEAGMLAQPKHAQGGSQAGEDAAKILGADHRSRSANYKRKEDEMEEVGTTRDQYESEDKERRSLGIRQEGHSTTQSLRVHQGADRRELGGRNESGAVDRVIDAHPNRPQLGDRRQYGKMRFKRAHREHEQDDEGHKFEKIREQRRTNETVRIPGGQGVERSHQ
jgi:hypothetical protein